MSLEFIYDALPGRVVFARAAARERLAEEVDHLRGRRVMLIAAEPERALAEALVRPLGGVVVAVFTGVRPHVPAEVAEDARRRAYDSGVDLLVSIGGGSTTGTAKAVALETGLPILAVPTTYAGSEMTPVWGITEAQRKTTGRAAVVQPKSVIYDPELTVSLPRSVTGPSAMNALAHCVEALYVPKANPIVSLLAENGVRALASGAKGAVTRPDDLDARDETLYGAYLAGAAFAAVGGGLHHKICHVLGGAYDLPHSETHTIILPQVAALFEPAVPEAMSRVARALDAPAAAAGLFDLAQRLDAPTALQDIGMQTHELERAIALVVEQLAGEHPRHVGEPEIRTILQSALVGSRPGAQAKELA